MSILRENDSSIKTNMVLINQLSMDQSKLPRSDVIAANFRGLKAPTEPEKGKFVYTNCLYDADELRVYDNKNSVVNSN